MILKYEWNKNAGKLLSLLIGLKVSSIYYPTNTSSILYPIYLSPVSSPSLSITPHLPKTRIDTFIGPKIIHIYFLSLFIDKNRTMPIN